MLQAAGSARSSSPAAASSTPTPSDLLVELAELLGVPVVPTLMGWGAIPDDHRLMAGMAGLQTVAPVRQRDDARVGLRARHRQPVGQPAHRRPRRLPARPHVRARRHRADPDRPGVPARLRDRLRRGGGAGAVRRGRAGAARGRAAARLRRVGRASAPKRKRTMLRRTPLRQRAGQAAAGVRGDEPARSAATPATCRTIGLSQIAGGQFLHVYKPRHWINAGQAGPLGWTLPAALGVCVGRPGRDRGRALGRLRLPVHDRGAGRRGAVQPALHPRRGEQLLPRADPPVPARVRHGLLRAAVVRQRQHARSLAGYGVDHVKVAEGLGCKALRVERPRGHPAGVREGQEADGASSACRCSSRSSSSGSRTSRWAPRSTTSSSSRSWPTLDEHAPDGHRPARLDGSDARASRGPRQVQGLADRARGRRARRGGHRRRGRRTSRS